MVTFLQRVAGPDGVLRKSFRALKFGVGLTVTEYPGQSLSGAQGGDGQITDFLEIDVTDAGLAAAVGPMTPTQAVAASKTWNVLLFGDSQTMGFSSGRAVSGYRSTFYQSLRQLRGDVDLVGPNQTYNDLDATYIARWDGAPGTAALGCWRHAGFSGKKIEDLTGYVPTPVAVTAPSVDVGVLMIGTNNVVAGDSLATLKTKFAALIAAISLQWPSSKWVVSTIPQFAPGSVTGGSYATYNAAAIAYNAWIVDTSTSGALYGLANFAAVDPCSTLSNGDYNSDGVHLNESGYGKLGAAFAVAVDRVCGPRHGLPAPRPFRQQPASTSLKLTTGATDFVQINANANLSPAAGNFACQVDYYPTALTAGNNSIFQHKDYSTSLAIFQNGGGLAIFMAGTVSIPAITCLTVNRWHRILVIGTVGGTIALFVNGQRIAIAMGALVPAWNVATNLNSFLGLDSAVNAALGYISNLRFAKGAAVPNGTSKAALDMAEACQFEGVPLLGETAFYKLDDAAGPVAPSVYNDPTGALGGGASVNNSQLHPWDYGF